MSTPKPIFEPLDLTELMTAGVLMAANERFFWPFGLALTWNYDEDSGVATDLHIREWRYADEHHESIGLEPGDETAAERRRQFTAWAEARVKTMPPGEQWLARTLLSTPRTPEATS